jgi:hypothetical protein
MEQQHDGAFFRPGHEKYGKGWLCTSPAWSVIIDSETGDARFVI